MQDPAWSRPLLREAQALAGLGRLQAALSIVRQALDLDPGDGQAQQLQAQLARQQGQPKPLPPMRIWTDPATRLLQTQWLQHCPRLMLLVSPLRCTRLKVWG